MEVDGDAIAAALGRAPIAVHGALCRGGIEAYRAALGESGELLVACTQEAPLFREVAAEAGADTSLAFTNIRERAGWCEGGPATAKMAALLADAMLPTKPARLRSVESDGVCLVYGGGQQALDAARVLAGRLSVTLVLTGADDILLPTVLDFAAHRGRLKGVTGSLGRFEVTLDGYAPMLPSSRAEPAFAIPRDGAKASCSIVVDLSGDPPPVTGWQKRDGYLAVDPGDPAAIARALFEASDLVGKFEKPIYVTYDKSICAHGRSKITGCSNCLDACPAGAITSEGDSVAIDGGICGGCGACASHCPTGAVSYAFPERGDLVRRVQTLLSVYRKAGGRTPILLFHEAGEGADILSAIARLGRGLPPHVIPIALHAAGMPGHDAFAAALAAGASAVVVLTDPRKAEDYASVSLEAALTNHVVTALGGGDNARIFLMSDRNPDFVETALWSMEPAAPLTAGMFEPVGGKRDVARTALSQLRAAIDGAPEVIALPERSPYGRVAIDKGGCTLCLSCVSACPVGALSDNPERPEVRFTETACVQCGLCAKTCPEKVISLVPQFNFAPSAMQPVTLNFEEPFHCVRCGKPFGARSSIERVSARLSAHAMFQGSGRAEIIKMCNDCRVQALAEMGDDPFAMGSRPPVRTTRDYLDARERGLSPEDFLADD